MSGLQLEKNEVVGYRFKPDWYNFTVCEIRKHGPNSRNAGQEYAIPLAYCKNVQFASDWLFQHVLNVQGEQNQKEREATAGSVADMKALLAAVDVAKTHVLKAVAELQGRFDALGLQPKDLVLALGGAAPEGESDNAS